MKKLLQSFIFSLVLSLFFPLITNATCQYSAGSSPICDTLPEPTRVIVIPPKTTHVIDTVPVTTINTTPTTDTTTTSTTSTPASFDISLKYGSRGDAVEQLQDFLTDQGFYTGKIDGKFGLGTLRSVKAFQKANGLAPDGFFGKASRAKATSILADILKSSQDAEKADQ